MLETYDGSLVLSNQIPVLRMEEEHRLIAEELGESLPTALVNQPSTAASILKVWAELDGFR